MNFEKALRAGLWEGARLPGLMIFSGMIGYGALCRDSELSLGFALASTGLMWALPGQLVLVEMLSAGNALLAMVLAVAMANARFLPMTMTMVPILRPGMRTRFWLYPMAHLVSFNSWIWVLRRCPDIPIHLRRTYYLGFVASNVAAATIGIVAGYALGGVLPASVVLGLVFVNSVYFVLMFAGVQRLPAILSVVMGGLIGPVLHLLSSDWGLLATGLIGGSLAFAVSCKRSAPDD